MPVIKPISSLRNQTKEIESICREQDQPVYLPPADKDLVSILDWIAKDNPRRAVEFVEHIEKRIGRLETHPFSGVIPRHQKLRDYGYRILIVEKYFVFLIIVHKYVNLICEIH